MLKSDCYVGQRVRKAFFDQVGTVIRLNKRTARVKWGSTDGPGEDSIAYHDLRPATDSWDDRFDDYDEWLSRTGSNSASRLGFDKKAKSYPAFTSKAQTSADVPLRMDEVDLGGLPGKLLVGFAPGKVQAGKWDRDMDADLDVLRHEEVTHVLCLVEDFELEMLQMADYAEKCADRGILLHRLPIKDGGIGKLDAVFTTALTMLWLIEKGERVYVHCKGGLGRAGTLAACILLLAAEETEDDVSAIAAVRAARSPRAIENKRQEQFIADFYHTYAGGN